MAQKSETQNKARAVTKIITIRAAFIPTSKSKGMRRPIAITDADGRVHQIQPLSSLEEDVRTFVAGRTLSIAESTNGRWEAVPIPPAQNKTAPAILQPALL